MPELPVHRGVRFREATLDDVPVLRALIERSARALSRGDYTLEQIEAALGGAWGVDSQLIRDRSYYVGEHEERAVVCGGWSWRKTLFGGDAQLGREPDRLDPRHEPARVRAFFVEPEWARLGLGRALLGLCEREARAAGYTAAALVATLPGERLYAACGYHSDGARSYPLGHDRSIVFVPMHKSL